MAKGYPIAFYMGFLRVFSLPLSGRLSADIAPAIVGVYHEECSIIFPRVCILSYSQFSKERTGKFKAVQVLKLWTLNCRRRHMYRNSPLGYRGKRLTSCPTQELLYNTILMNRRGPISGLWLAEVRPQGVKTKLRTWVAEMRCNRSTFCQKSWHAILANDVACDVFFYLVLVYCMHLLIRGGVFIWSQWPGTNRNSRCAHFGLLPFWHYHSMFDTAVCFVLLLCYYLILGGFALSSRSRFWRGETFFLPGQPCAGLSEEQAIIFVQRM